MRKSIVRIFIGFGVLLGTLFVLGIGAIVWQSYCMTRNPVYQTAMTDFEIHDKHFDDITQKLDILGVKKVYCFIFQAHPNRPTYAIILVGKCAKNVKLPAAEKNYFFTDHINILTALKLSGANPDSDGVFKEIMKISYSSYIYHDWIIIKTVRGSTPFLFDDAQMQSFLKRYISRKDTRDQGSCAESSRKEIKNGKTD